MRLFNLIVLLLCATSLVVLTGCPRPVGIAVLVAKSTIKVGETTTATAVSTNAKDTFAWSSSADAIATVTTDGKVTGKAVGKATITATASDSKKTGSVEVTVEAAAPVEGEGEAAEGEGEAPGEGEEGEAVADTTAPVITLLGNASVKIEQGSVYTDAGATAADDTDGDITSSIHVAGTVNTAVLGDYTLAYHVSDAAGNAAAEVTRIVHVVADATPPVITLVGDAEVILAVGEAYTDAGATALDDTDGDITGNIVVVSTVNTSVIGEYTVKYNVSDAGGNAAAQVTRTVRVVATVHFNARYDRVDGVSNVGVGTVLALAMEVPEGGPFTGTWTLDSKPAGSTATLPAGKAIDSGASVALSPDVEGNYDLTLTLSDGVNPDIAVMGTIHASTYTGVGIVQASGPSVVPTLTQPQCGCHNGVLAPNKITPWLETGHATMLIRNINNWDNNAQASYHYGMNCVECHSVGFNADADNGGFDDVKGDWTVPAWSADMSGNWTSLVTSNPEAAKRGNIQCENCHGPAAEHKNSGEASLIAVSIDNASCEPCHGEPPRHAKIQQLELSGHSEKESEAFVHWDEDAVEGEDGIVSTSCAKCHSGYGYIEFAQTGTVAAKVPAHDISCATCHDPHSDENPSQLRIYDAVTLPWDANPRTGFAESATCMTCHNGRRAKSTALAASPGFSHYLAAAPVLLGENAYLFGASVSNSSHKEIANCVECHMAAGPSSGSFRNMVGSHTFKFEDPTGAFENFANACNVCHNGWGPLTSVDPVAKADYDGDGTVESVDAEIQGLLTLVEGAIETANPGLQHVESHPYWSPVPANWDNADDPGTIDVLEGLGLSGGALQTLEQAVWNYMLILEDPGAAVHNTKFAAGLLQITYNAVTGTDVPNASLVYGGAVTTP